jgi:hypothetical protein
VQQDRRIADLEAHILRLCSCMDPPAIDRRCFVHGDPPASTWRLARDRTRAAEHEAERLEAELAAARAEIADHEREAETTGRIIGDLEAINGDVSGENAKLRAGLGEGIAAVTEADERVLRANAVVNEAQAAMNGMAAERDEARAETEAVRAIVGGWISDANDGYGSDPNDLAGLLEAHDASGAPESPADATALPRTPDA